MSHPALLKETLKSGLLSTRPPGTSLYERFLEKYRVNPIPRRTSSVSLTGSLAKPDYVLSPYGDRPSAESPLASQDENMEPAQEIHGTRYTKTGVNWATVNSAGSPQQSRPTTRVPIILRFPNPLRAAGIEAMSGNGRREVHGFISHSRQQGNTIQAKPWNTSLNLRGKKRGPQPGKRSPFKRLCALAEMQNLTDCGGIFLAFHSNKEDDACVLGLLSDIEEA